MPRNMHLDVEWVLERYNKFSKSDRLEWYVPKKVVASKETRRSWYHAIDKKYVHILVKFEDRLSRQFGRKQRNKPFSNGWLKLLFCKKLSMSQN
jgi:hypothetical protein